MSKCLRCGAGQEWLQGKIPDDAEWLAKHDAEVRRQTRAIVENVVRRTAQADCAVELNVETAMREFDAALALATASPSDGGQVKEQP